jgi:hypothetical protein
MLNGPKGHLPRPTSAGSERDTADSSGTAALARRVRERHASPCTRRDGAAPKGQAPNEASMRPLGTPEPGARVAGEDHVLAARATRVTGG